MEDIGSSSNAPQNHSSDSDDAKNAKFTEAEIAWYKMRSEWVGDRSKRSQRPPREPIVRESFRHEQILMSVCYDFFDPFEQPVPLGIMLKCFGNSYEKGKCYDNVDW